MVLDKPDGIFALVDNYLGIYTIETFHYIDFRWYSKSAAAKIMHKANIEEWQDENGISFKFSESPFKNHGDVLGVMSGDFRDCFDEIINQEKQRQILFEGTIELPSNGYSKKVKFRSGIGLQNLTLIEKITADNPQRMGLYCISQID